MTASVRDGAKKMSDEEMLYAIDFCVGGGVRYIAERTRCNCKAYSREALRQVPGRAGKREISFTYHMMWLHGLGCTKKGQLIHRHDAATDIAVKYLRRLRWRAAREEIPLGRSIKGDAWAQIFRVKAGRKHIFDTTFMSPFTQGNLNGAASKELYVERKAEKGKRDIKEKACVDRGWIFIPWASNACGGMGEAEDAFWMSEYNYKSKRCAEWGMSQFQVASEKKHLYTDLSVSVWKHNYAIMEQNTSPPELRRGHERGRSAGGGGNARRQLKTQGPLDYGPVGARHGQARARPLHALDTERNGTTSHDALTPIPGGGGHALTPRGGGAVREGCRDRVGHRRDRVTARSAK